MDQYTSFVINHWELFLALVLIVAMLLGTNLQSAMTGVRQVDPVEAIRMINHERAVIVDVREDKEFAEGHIINALHIPLGNVQQRIKDLEQHKEKPIIVSCRSGARSNSACGMLRKQGFENVFNLKGGIMAWQNASLPLKK